VSELRDAASKAINEIALLAIVNADSFPKAAKELSRIANDLSRVVDRRTPAAQDTAQGREIGTICHIGEKLGHEWFVEVTLRLPLSAALRVGDKLYAAPTPATPTTNSGEIGRKSVGGPAGRGFVCAGDAIRCHDGHGCECAMSGLITTPDSMAAVQEAAHVREVVAFRRCYPEGGKSQWYDAKIESEMLDAFIRSGKVELAYATADSTAASIAVAQAVEFAEYVESHAKGAMVQAARRFLSLPYAQEIATRLSPNPSPNGVTK
jgi:hypothetical protein